MNNNLCPAVKDKIEIKERDFLVPTISLSESGLLDVSACS